MPENCGSSSHKEIVSALRVPVLEKEGYEADVCRHLARKLEREVKRVSGDKDLMQLISSHVSMYDSMKVKTFQVPE
jgi:DNA polymerase-1